MYKKNKINKTKLTRNTSYKGETIEEKVSRIVNNKEPISDGAPITYTERKDGVLPEFNIRTDRFEVAIDAMDAVTKSHQAKREQRIGEKTYDTMNSEQQAEFNKKYPQNKYATAARNAGTGESTP